MIEIVEHTADVRLRVAAPTREELFAEALRGTMQLLHPEAGEPVAPRPLDLEAPDVTYLLADFLGEALSNAHAWRETYDNARFETLTDTRIVATLEGRRALHFGSDVKAVTYHEAEVVFDGAQWSTTIVCDI